MFMTSSLEDVQRQFYALSDESISEIVRSVLEEELSVVSGGVLDQFERDVAEFLGSSHAVAVTNGTAAIHTALFAMDLKPGEEVIIPAFGYYAMALPVCILGARPVFCDVNENDLSIDVEEAESLLTDKTRAVIVHQPYGCPADADRLREFADRHNLKLIADASHAQGALWDGKPLGKYYDYLCASFGKGKLISGGDLGVVTAMNDRCRDRMLLYGHVNRVPGAYLTDEYKHIANAIGIKYRPHAFALALAHMQLNSYKERSDRLVRNIQEFERGLENIPGISPYETPEKASRVYWRIPLRIDINLHDPATLVEKLKARGCPVEQMVGTLVPLHSAVTDYYNIPAGRSFPVSENIMAGSIRVHPFPLYENGVAERLLHEFEEVSKE